MEFIKGMDISTLPEMLDKGFVYRDEDGTPIDPFVLIKKNGVNSVRLRIWNEPENLPESGGYCNLSDTIRMARKIKENGMSFFLDFHYSDWWADPGQQRKPKAWEGLSFQKLVEAVHDYTYTVLKTLEKEEVYPEYVQIGNEIRSGMLFPEGEVRNFPQLAQLINAGIQAVRELDVEHEEGRSMMESLSEEQFPYPEMPVTTGAGNGKGIRKNIPRVKLVIHLDQGGRYQYFENWFDKAIANGVTDFDIIALSYYPFWHGTFAEFRDCMERVIERYHRPVMAAETAHAWRLAEGGFVTEQQVRISGFPASPEGQRRVVELVMNIVASLKNGMGLGVYYWEPLDIPRPGGNGWSASMGIMTADARPTVAMSAFRFVPDARKNRLPVKVLSVIPKEEVSTIKPDFRLRSDAANECIEKNSPRTETKNENSGQGSSDFGKWLVTEDNWTMLTDSGMGKRCALGEDRSCSSHTLAELLQELKLPEKVRILTFDGKTEIRDAVWTNAELCESGTENTVVCRNWTGTSLQAPFVLTLTGTTRRAVQSTGEEIYTEGELPLHYTLQVEERWIEKTNYFPAGSFSAGLDGWNLEAQDVECEVKRQKNGNAFYFESENNFRLRLNSEVWLPEPGKYTFRLQYFGTNTTGVEVNMNVCSAAGTPQERHYVEWIYPQDKDWLDYEITGITMEHPGRLIVGLEVKAPPVWGYIRALSIYTEE